MSYKVSLVSNGLLTFLYECILLGLTFLRERATYSVIYFTLANGAWIFSNLISRLLQAIICSHLDVYETLLRHRNYKNYQRFCDSWYKYGGRSLIQQILSDLCPWWNQDYIELSRSLSSANSHWCKILTEFDMKFISSVFAYVAKC